MGLVDGAVTSVLRYACVETVAYRRKELGGWTMNTNTKAPEAGSGSATKALEPQPIRLTYSIQEAGDLLGIGRSLAYDLAKEGTLPGVRRLGRRYVVSKQALDAWLETPM